MIRKKKIDREEKIRGEQLRWQKLRRGGGMSVAAAVYEDVGGETFHLSMSALTF